MPEMNMKHRLNVWRIAHKCPACGGERGYSQANPGGIEFNCSDMTCFFTEFVPNASIHASGYDDVRFDVLDCDNKVREGWNYTPSEYDIRAIISRRKKYGYRKKSRWE
jgi:hypothetical protein